MYQTLTNVNNLILTLIMADLRNAKFLKCFEDADIAVENFDTRLGRSIFKLFSKEITKCEVNEGSIRREFIYKQAQFQVKFCSDG